MKTVLSVNKIEYSGNRYDIEVEDNHNYYADGILVHNCALPKDAKFKTWDWEKGVISQEKADGMFATLNKSKGDISIMSRSGKPFNPDSFPVLVAYATEFLNDDTQTQGELLVCDRNGDVLERQIGNGILNKVAQGGEFPEGTYPIYKAWDQLPISAVEPKTKFMIGYSTRLHSLNQQLADSKGIISVIDTKIVNSMEEAKAHYVEMLNEGKEGTVLSEPHAPWIDSTSKFKIKFKLTAPCELRVKSYRPGNGKNAELFGALVCESEDGLLEVGVSGFTDAKRKEIFDNFETDWKDSIITVESNMILEPSREGKKWSLFLPRFSEQRLDKSSADTLEKIKEQFEAAISSI